MRLRTSTDTDHSFKLKFSSSESVFKNIHLNKTASNLDIHSNVSPTEEDITYDEVIYYDGGGVEGYGD
jgi:hypothetical protein